MDDLIAFVLARLDDEEQTAEATGGGNWKAMRMAGVGYFVGDEDGRSVARLWVDLGDLMDEPQPLTVSPVVTGKHIASQDPARTIRDVQARRKTVIRCQEEMLSGIPRLVHFAQQTLWEMAQRWADHADFRPELRP